MTLDELTEAANSPLTRLAEQTGTSRETIGNTFLDYLSEGYTKAQALDKVTRMAHDTSRGDVEDPAREDALAGYGVPEKLYPRSTDRHFSGIYDA
jgi:hypothetical protein